MEDCKILENAGFERIEVEKCVKYRTPWPKQWLYKAQEVKNYLNKAHADGRLLDLQASMFSFKKSKGEGEGQRCRKFCCFALAP